MESRSLSRTIPPLMQKPHSLNQADDLDLLSPRERAAEAKAEAEERQKLTWLADSPQQIASRIPNSVFALGQVGAC